MFLDMLGAIFSNCALYIWCTSVRVAPRRRWYSLACLGRRVVVDAMACTRARCRFIALPSFRTESFFHAFSTNIRVRLQSCTVSVPLRFVTYCFLPFQFPRILQSHGGTVVQCHRETRSDQCGPACRISQGKSKCDGPRCIWYASLSSCNIVLG